MAAGWLEIASAALRLATLFVIALFLPVILQLLLLFTAGWALDRLVAFVSRSLYYFLNLIGTPVHEFSHAIAALLTLNRVMAIKPLLGDPREAFVLCKKMNLPGRIATSVAPLFGGSLVLWLTARYIIPGFEVPTVTLPQLNLESSASFITVVQESMEYLGSFVRAAYQNLPSLQWDNWRTYVGLYIAVSVGVGIAPSPGDLKMFLMTLPLALLLILGLFVLLYLSGAVESTFLAVQEGLLPPLLKFSTAITYAFVLTSLGMLVFLPLRLLQRLRRG